MAVPLAIAASFLSMLRCCAVVQNPHALLSVPCCPALAQGAAKKTLTGAVSFLKDLTHTASNLYHKRTDDEEEEAEYLKVGGRGRGVGAVQHVLPEYNDAHAAAGVASIIPQLPRLLLLTSTSPALLFPHVCLPACLPAGTGLCA
jgi:hypothetical protein